MSTSARGLFVFLVALLLLATVLGYAGIARLRQKHYPPFNQGLYTATVLISHPPNKVVLFLDSSFGRALAWGLALGIPIGCGLLVFKHDRLLVGFVVLICFAALAGGTGFSLFIHALLDAS